MLSDRRLYMDWFDIHSILPRVVRKPKSPGKGLLRFFLRSSVIELDRRKQYRVLRDKRSPVNNRKRDWVLAVSDSWSRDHLDCAKDAILRMGFKECRQVFATNGDRIKFYQPSELDLKEVTDVAVGGFYLSYTIPEGVTLNSTVEPLYDPFFIE